jgi:hypothetical protein
MGLAMLEHPFPLAFFDERLLVRDELFLAFGPGHQIHRGKLLIDL